MARTRGNWKVRECAETVESFLTEAYSKRSGEGDLQTQLCDVLADLMHLAYSRRLDFEQALASAYNHHHTEVQPRFSEGRDC